jgi:putative ATPase
MQDVESGRTLKVPERLRNKRLKAAAGPADGESSQYVYPHDYGGHFVDQEYVPTDTRYYEPSDQGYETTIAKRLAFWRGARAR